MSWACDHCGNLNPTDGTPCESCGQVHNPAAPRVDVSPQPPPPVAAIAPPVAAIAPPAVAAPAPTPPTGRAGLIESILGVVVVGCAYMAGMIGFMVGLASCFGGGSCSSNMAHARHDFEVSGWTSLAGNVLAIALGSVALARARRGTGARTMGILGLVLGLVGVCGSALLFLLAEVK